jgi:hypothetical protein
MDRYILYACLTVTRIWLIVTLALFAIYSLSRRRAGRASFAARAARQSLVAHPFVIATGVQIIKRVAALAAVAGTAMAPVSKPASPSRREAPGEP